MRAAVLALLATVACLVVVPPRPAFAGEALIDALLFWRAEEARLTQSLARRAVRETLRIASATAMQRLGAEGGFTDAAGRPALPLPRPLAEAQAVLRPVGRAQELDELERRINRAAERAVLALDGVVDREIDLLVLSDAVALVRGRPDGATQFLRLRSEPRLLEALRPAMSQALVDTGAASLVEAAAREARASGRAEEWRQRLSAECAELVLDRFFAAMAAEEAALRRDPVRQTSEALRRAYRVRSGA